MAKGMEADSILNTLGDPEFAEAVEITSVFTKEDKRRHACDQRENSERMMNTWIRTGYLEGKLETARAMPKDGITIEHILKYTGLTQEELAAAAIVEAYQTDH